MSSTVPEKLGGHQLIEKRQWPWIAQQNWQDILFIHLPTSYEKLRSLVPAPFKIDTYDGQGWMSIVLFRATHSRLRYMPEPLSFPPFYQMNIRTYVTFRNEPGVYFFSINTNNSFVKLGGSLASLPFSKANMTMQQEEDKIYFEANRLFNERNAAFKVAYSPDVSSFSPRAASLSYFLTERYCIWMFRGNTILKAPILHSRWNLQQATISILKNTNLPFHFTEDMIAHYAPFKHSLIHPFERFGKVSK